ncbi:MAG TPA: hypothetical protein VKY85_03515 [Candidatus Angelobacter sp.]|nr:hypothetical protein [Candidatus Angelobacter sp.]
MSRSVKIQAIIEEAVSEVFEAALPKLRAEIITRTVQELESLEPAPGSLPTDLLKAAAFSIQDSASQAEILRHLLEGVARFCGRAALFVIKGASMNGWQGTGFESNEVVKTINLSAANGLAGSALQGRSPVTGRAEEFDAGFVSTVGAPVDGNCVVLPLVVKEKVAALIYADVGNLPDCTVDASALALLCRFTALWLELTALRKAGITAAPEEAHVPAPAVAGAAVAAAPGDGVPAAAPVAEEDDLHKKARRFARLLVDEIKLYNQAKVAEGRQSRDLYDRLKEDIEKSRAAFDKKFGASPAASANYFTQELIRILADNDVSLMGVTFPH